MSVENPSGDPLEPIPPDLANDLEFGQEDLHMAGTGKGKDHHSREHYHRYRIPSAQHIGGP